MSTKNSTLPRKRCKNVYRQIDENDPDKKLNEKFAEKCYFYNLPLNWHDEYRYINTDESKKTKLTSVYNTVKQHLVNKTITLTDILKITGITHNERVELIEDYAFMQSYDTDIREYGRLRETLRKKIQYFQHRNIPFHDVILKDKQKDKLSSFNISRNEMEDKILNMHCDEYTKAVIYQKYSKLNTMAPTDNEYHKLHEWVNFVVNIPFNKSKSITMDGDNAIATIKQKLDEEIYGMTHVKEEIILFLMQKLKNPEASNLSLALAGPPGVGKTKIISTLSKIMNIPFEHIPMGGVEDASYLSGDLYVYEGSKPGKILNTACKLGCNNGIIFFDEIDKIAPTFKGKGVTSKMIHITDFTQNDKFADNYCPELNFGLDKFWYIFTLNDEKEVNNVLRDRMYIVNIPGYSIKEKKELIKCHIIPEVLKRYNMDIDDIVISDEVNTYIINKCKEEEGIRELKRLYDVLYRKLDALCDLYKNQDTSTKLSFNIPNFKLPYTLKITDVNTLISNYNKNKIPMGLYV